MKKTCNYYFLQLFYMITQQEQSRILPILFHISSDKNGAAVRVLSNSFRNPPHHSRVKNIVYLYVVDTYMIK